MRSTVMLGSLKSLPLNIFIALAATATCQLGVAADTSVGPRTERTQPARQQSPRAPGAVSFAVEQMAPTDVPPRTSHIMHGDPSLLLPELRAGRSATPGGQFLAPQIDPRLKPLGW
jgi:hypothetical protein